jgi:hypothetical protein
LVVGVPSILGFVFQRDPGLQRQLLDSTPGRMPAVGPQINGDVRSLTGSGVALAVGVVGALCTGLGVILAIVSARSHLGRAAGEPSQCSQLAMRGLLVLSRSARSMWSCPPRSVWWRPTGVGTTVTKVLSDPTRTADGSLRAPVPAQPQ